MAQASPLDARRDNDGCAWRSALTKNGKPVAELRPHRGPRAKSLIGLHEGQGKILGDIISPIGTELWEALK